MLRPYENAIRVHSLIIASRTLQPLPLDFRTNIRMRQLELGWERVGSGVEGIAGKAEDTTCCAPTESVTIRT